MNAFFKFSSGGLVERRETKICAEFTLDKSIIRMIRYITTRNRIPAYTFPGNVKKSSGYSSAKRVHPHRNWKVLHHIFDSRGHVFSLRRSYLLVLFRRFHPIVIPKIPSQNILSISDRERNTGRRVIASPRAEATKKTSKIYNGNKSNKLLFIASVQIV